MNARLAFGGLLLLGIADLGLVNLKLAPEYAEEQAKQAHTDGIPPAKSAAAPLPTPMAPTAAKSASVAVAPPQPTVEPPASAEPVATAPADSANSEPTAVAVASTTPPTPTAEPPPAPPATQAPPAPPPVVASGDKPGAVSDIMFELDSGLLTLASKSTLDDVLAKLKANSSLRVHLRGHSDQLGSREHNVELSRKRAAAVEGFLLASGIAHGRITTEAVGGSKPADPSNTPAAWARNRRVEIEWR